MRRYLLSLLLILLPVAVFAQGSSTQQATVSGTVVDETDSPLPAASVAIQSPDGSEVITGASTNPDGTFEISVDPGQYVLEVTFLSYQTREQEIDLSSGEELSVGTIQMQPQTEELGEVVVRGEKSRMQMSFDKRVFDVGRDLTSMGGSALDVLDNVPSLSLDIDGNISLRGNESVRVLINGQESNMVSNGVDALRSLPASMIQEVEIITNPSAAYAASGSGGIINIILKKDQRLGFNGSASVGSGIPQEHEVSTNLNYRTPNVNWFFGGGLDYSSEPEDGSSFQRFAGPDTTYMYREQTDASESEVDGNVRLGADIYLTDTQTLTASSYINLEGQDNTEDVTYTDLEYAPGAFSGDVLQRVVRENVEDGSERSVDFNLEYRNQFDGREHQLTADASFDIERESSNTNIEETIRQGSGDPLLQRTEDIQTGKDMRFDLEYVRPLGEGGKLEAGLRSDTEWSDNSYMVEEQNDNGIWQELPGGFNNNFQYMQNVNAAYLILGSEWGNFSGQVGLRAENTRITTSIKGTDQETNQNYLNLFPSVFLNYSINEQNSLQLSYSRRLERPWSRELLPFSDYSDTRSRFTGNPDLRPEFSNSYEAGYLRTWETGSLLTSFYYRYRTDVTEDITQQEDGILRRFPINLATEKAWGVEFSADQDLFDNFTLTGTANFFRSESDGSYQNQLFSSESQNFQSRLSVRWEIAGAWNYEASMRYRGPRETTQGSSAGSTMMDMGVSRDLFDGQAQLSLNVRDVFNSQNFNNTVTDDGNPNTDFYSQREFSWSTRSFSVNFRYFFRGSGGEERGGGRGDYDR